MCGILGFLGQESLVNHHSFEQSLNQIIHRGPDDFGIEKFTFHSGESWLGFRRLSILDLSMAGHQPMKYEHFSMVFNGEVYNYQEIKSELLKVGYHFISDGDTEVILKAFHFWGIEAVQRFNGMFAIALLDSLSGKLFLIRDRMGIKPLYYYWKDHNLVFSSEVGPLLKFDWVNRDIDPSSLYTYFVHGYVPAPKTVFKYIKSLEPGKFAVIENNELRTETYWQLTKIVENRPLPISNFEEAKYQLDQLLHSSVQYRMISDVPLGAFLSGGIDSSLVTAIMQKQSSTPINTFTIGFEDGDYNEAGFAKEVSKHLGTNHFEAILSLKTAEEELQKMVRQMDMPFGDSSLLPTLMLSQITKEKVTVALSGDGGDELFCGYKLYDQATRLQSFKTIASGVLPFRNYLTNQKWVRDHYKYLGILFSDSDSNIINSGSLAASVFIKNMIKGAPNYSNSYFDTNARHSANIQEANMILNMKSYLPDDVLKKVDLATMAHSLEARVPILDYRIVEFSFRLPHKFKCDHGNKKRILKEVLYQYVPQKMMDRPKKGFSVPVFKWLHHDLNHLVEHYCSHQFISKQALFDQSVLDNLKTVFNKQPNNYFTNGLMWNFIVFQMWYEKNLM